MKVVILCGELGTRLRRETEFRPKPMVPVGEHPFLWHIMKTYAHKEFILCLGYQGEAIKNHFRNYHWNRSDVTLRPDAEPQIKYHSKHSEPDWTVTMVDTGQNTMTGTGGRVKRVSPDVKDDTFLLTYGDGERDSDIKTSTKFHRTQEKILARTAVQPPGRFGDLEINDGKAERKVW